MTYCISDVHGQGDLFEALLKKINYCEQSDKLYVLGDVVDRGPEGIKIISKIMDMPSVELLLGNHELMVRDALTIDYEYVKSTKRFLKEDYFELWMSNGGDQTYEEWLGQNDVQRYRVLSFLWRLREWIFTQVNGQSFLLVHAGIDASFRGTVEGNNLNDLIKNLMDAQVKPHDLRNCRPSSMYNSDSIFWIRSEFLKRPALGERDGVVIVFGHTPTARLIDGTKVTFWKDERYQDKIGIDCGAYSTGVMGALCLETLEETYVCRDETF